jgi:homoserine dehydrogenase
MTWPMPLVASLASWTATASATPDFAWLTPWCAGVSAFTKNTLDPLRCPQGGGLKRTNMSQNTLKPVKVGLMGIGTVGGGTFTVLQRNQEEIRRRAGRGIEIAMVADLNTELAKTVVGDSAQIVSDARQIIANPEIDVVVELIGGYGIAKALVLEAIAAGKHVVTANKALLAVHGTEIFAAARAKGVIVAFEAAVAGGIPIIKALREGLTANQIQWVAGIINGTTNFILSEMRDKGLDFDVVLKEAQRLGYAEADPTFDIEGVDAAHKATLLSAIAFGIPVQFDKAHVEGITKLSATDIKYAEQLGYRIKLLGIARRRANGIELRTHPTLVPNKRLIANVEGAMNAVLVQGDAVGTTMYYGKGAGAEPTASAVVADLVDIARLLDAAPEARVPYLAFQPDSMSALPILSIDEVITSFYLRLRVADEAGVLAKITGILAEQGISIDAVIQREADQVSEGNQTDLIILTHDTTEGSMNKALVTMQALPSVLAPIMRLRKEELA